MNEHLMNELSTDHPHTDHLLADQRPVNTPSSLDAVITDLADIVDPANIADLAPPFLRPMSEPWLAPGFLAAGHVTVLTGDAHAH